MPQTDVEVRFKANVEGLRSAVQGVNGQLQSVAGQKIGAAGLDKMEEGAHKSTRAVKETHESLTAFGRATEVAKDKLGEFTKEATRFSLGFLGVAGAFEAVKHAFEAGSAVETARVRMQALVGSVEKGNEAFESLEKISDETSTGIEHIADAAQSLVASGTGLDELPTKLDAIAKAAQVTGQPIEYIADLLSRIQLRGDVSARELFRITQATGGATRQLAEQYRDLENAQKNYLETQKRAGVAGLGEKTGLTESVFAQFSKEPLRQGFAIVEGFAGTQINRLSTSLVQRFRQGIHEIAHEAGVSDAAIFQLSKQGVYTPQDLISASDQGRERERNEERLKILDQVSNALTELNQKGGALAENFTRWADTAAGKWAAAAHQIDKGFEDVGTRLIQHLQGVEVAVGAVTSALVIWNGLKFFGLIGQLKGVAAATAEVEAAAKAATVVEGEMAVAGTVALTSVLADLALVIAGFVTLSAAIKGGIEGFNYLQTEAGKSDYSRQERARLKPGEGVKETLAQPIKQPVSAPEIAAEPEKPAEKNLYEPNSGGLPARSAHLGRWGEVLPIGPSEATGRWGQTIRPREREGEGAERSVALASRETTPEAGSDEASKAAFRRLWEPVSGPNAREGRTPLVNFPSKAPQGQNLYGPYSDLIKKEGSGAFAPGQIRPWLTTPSQAGAAGVTQPGILQPSLPIRPEDVQARREGRAPDQQKELEPLNAIKENTAGIREDLKQAFSAGGGQS